MPEPSKNPLSPASLKFAPHAVIGTSVPAPVIDFIDRLAGAEFISRSAWLRRTIMEAVAEEV